jgi:hypothetical protein
MLALAKDRIDIPFVSVNAIFPIISFFLLDNSRKYREYRPLYIAAKVISVVSGLSWVIFTLGSSPQMATSSFVRPNIVALFVLGVTAADALTIAARLLLPQLETDDDKLITGDTTPCE